MEKLKDLKEGDLLEIIENKSKPGPIHKFNVGDIVKVLSFDTDDWYGDRINAFCELKNGGDRAWYVHNGDFKMLKKILYIDMDGVIVDFLSAIKKLHPQSFKKYENNPDEIHGIFGLLEPIPGAIESVKFLSKHFSIYILSTASWENPSAWSDKLKWIKKYLPEVAHKRLILTHNKQLNKGDYLIDDRTANGADKFAGELIHFGKGKFKTWADVLNYLQLKEKIRK